MHSIRFGSLAVRRCQIGDRCFDEFQDIASRNRVVIKIARDSGWKYFYVDRLILFRSRDMMSTECDELFGDTTYETC